MKDRDLNALFNNKRASQLTLSCRKTVNISVLQRIL